jgi:hypothetical protein
VTPGEERTLQQRDPLGALVGRPTSYLAAIGVPLFAAFTTWNNRGDIESVPLALLSLVLIGVGAVVLVLQSGPLRAPLTARTHAVIVISALAAMVTSSLAMGSHDAYVRDDWGAPAVGLYILSLAPYRPAKEIATSGVLSAIFVGFVVVVHADAFALSLPPIAFVIVAMTPVLAASLGAAAFADVLVRSLDRWQVRARRAFTSLADERGESIARSVQQDRVTILNQEVVPFFSDLLEGATVTEQTRERAREISDAIRAVIVAEAERTWLDGVVEGLARYTPGGTGSLHATVHDRHRLAEHMSADERTAVRALIVALHGDRSFQPEEMTVSLAQDGERCDVAIQAVLEADDGAQRSDIAPFLAVMRVIFSDLQVEHDPPALTLRFSYDQR